MGTWGPGAFESALELIFREAAAHPHDLSSVLNPGEVVAAAAVIVAGLI